MSEYIFKLPDLGEGTVESEIGEWFVKVGDDVAEEDVVGTMMTDKAAIEVSSPVSGRVVRLAGEPGDIVAVGMPLIVFETNGAAAAPEATPTQAMMAADTEEPGEGRARVAATSAAPAAPEEQPRRPVPESFCPSRSGRGSPVRPSRRTPPNVDPTAVPRRQAFRL